MKVVVFCGYNYSKHAIALMESLEREGFEIDKCLIVSAFSLKRIKFYFNQLDRKEFVKKLKDRILGNVIKTKISDEMKYILNLYDELNISDKKVSKYCQRKGISFKIVKSLNSKEALDFAVNGTLAIYAGGGIVGKKMLSNFEIGVLNCHGGKLPELRGMNVAEWSVLTKTPIVHTLHFMVRKLDMGPIIKIVPHDYSQCTSIDQLRGLSIVYTIFDLVVGAKMIREGDLKLKKQKAEEGKLYFTMHPILKDIVNKRLQQTDV